MAAQTPANAINASFSAMFDFMVVSCLLSLPTLEAALALEISCHSEFQEAFVHFRNEK
jgi:hypothetical protein